MMVIRAGSMTNSAVGSTAQMADTMRHNSVPLLGIGKIRESWGHKIAWLIGQYSTVIGVTLDRISRLWNISHPCWNLTNAVGIMGKWLEREPVKLTFSVGYVIIGGLTLERRKGRIMVREEGKWLRNRR